jgi:hemerythrin-like domain-containing protein
MKEHRLIERMAGPIREAVRRMQATGEVAPVFVDATVDFIRTYADRCHHGKEEGILFRDLEDKPLAEEHRRIMDELVTEHVYARKTVARMLEGKRRFLGGDAEAVKSVMNCLGELLEFYPLHIEKEDQRFFKPAMDYFSEAQQAEMLEECREFDRTVIHDHYAEVMERMEEAMSRGS